MDASFMGFMSYRPKKFTRVTPRRCGRMNHAVVAVGNVYEGGRNLFIVRNSWGKNWGYQGHFKIQKGNRDCGISKMAWLPTMHESYTPPKPTPPKPSPKPAPTPSPKPAPVSANQCVELFGSTGFKGKPLLKACDGVPELDKYYFYGVKFPQHADPQLSIRAFPWQDCGGRFNIHVTKTTEFIEKDGHKVYSASMSKHKEGPSGCVNFYTKTCISGVPLFEVCGSVSNTQAVDYSELPKIQSILPGLGVHRITFFTQKDYEGLAIAIEGKEALFNIGMNWRLGNLFRKGMIRSIKIHKF